RPPVPTSTEAPLAATCPRTSVACAMARIDPTDGTAIGTAFVEYVTAHLDARDVALATPLRSAGAGMSTFTWFAELQAPDLPAPRREPLVLRIHPVSTEAEVNAREAAVQAFVAARGFPAPQPLVVDSEPSGEHNPFGLPFMVMPKAPGTTVLRAFT